MKMQVKHWHWMCCRRRKKRIFLKAAHWKSLASPLFFFLLQCNKKWLFIERPRCHRMTILSAMKNLLKWRKNEKKRSERNENDVIKIKLMRKKFDWKTIISITRSHLKGVYSMCSEWNGYWLSVNWLNINNIHKNP